MLGWWKKQPTRGKVVVLVIPAVIAAIAIGAALEGDDDEPVSEPAQTQSEPEPELSSDEATEALEEGLTAELLVDVLEDTEPEKIRQLCREEDSFGEGLVYEGFSTGYTLEEPSPEEVFDEVMSRC